MVSSLARGTILLSSSSHFTVLSISILWEVLHCSNNRSVSFNNTDSSIPCIWGHQYCFPGIRFLFITCTRRLCIKSLKTASQTLQKGTCLRQARKWGTFLKAGLLQVELQRNLQCCWPVGRDRLLSFRQLLGAFKIMPWAIPRVWVMSCNCLKSSTEFHLNV